MKKNKHRFKKPIFMRRFWKNYRRIRAHAKFSNDPVDILNGYKIDRIGGIAF